MAWKVSGYTPMRRVNCTWFTLVSLVRHLLPWATLSQEVQRGAGHSSIPTASERASTLPKGSRGARRTRGPPLALLRVPELPSHDLELATVEMP